MHLSNFGVSGEFAALAVVQHAALVIVYTGSPMT
jgi:hypothetical protein